MHDFLQFFLRLFRTADRLFLLGVIGGWFAGLHAGELTERYELSLARIGRGGPPFFSDAFVLADAAPQHTRRFTEYNGDLSGRYIGAMAAAAQHGQRKDPELDRLVHELVALQKPDGHFGDPFSATGLVQGDMLKLWGNGRLLVGLLDYQRFNPSPAILASARHLGEFLIGLAPRFSSPEVRQKLSGDQIGAGYICWTQTTEGLVELYRVTQDERFLRTAGEIALNTHRYEKQHVHGFLTSLRGTLELYRVTRDPRWLQELEAEWNGILASGNLLPHGAVPETFKPLVVRDEGCAEADWLRLNLALWRETRNPKYLENAELTLFNAFYSNQFQNGDFGHRPFTEAGLGTEAVKAWWCCTFHAVRAFPEIFQSAFHDDHGTLCYDLPVDGKGASGELSIRADSTLERDGMVTLQVLAGEGREKPLWIRQPKWASAIEFQAGGRRVAGTPDGAGLKVQLPWRTGESLTIRYVMQTQIMRHPDGGTRIAFTHGPWVLGVDEQREADFFNEPADLNRIQLPRGKDGSRLQPAGVAGPPSREESFVIPSAHFRLPYLPGGYQMQPQTAVLRPVAEQTGLADKTQWIVWFDPVP